MNNKQASQTDSFYPLLFFGSHSDPLKHFLNFFCFNRCSLPSYFGKWTTFLHLFLSLAPHHVLGLGLGKYNNKYVKRISFYVKKSSFNWLWWEFYWLLNFNRSLNFLFFLCSSSFNLFIFLKIINNDKCKCKRCSLSLKVLQCFFKSFSHSSNTP